MDDNEIHETINRLVDEEHRLRSGPMHDDGHRERLRTLEESLDQCWDLLRQRQAKRDAGDDPDLAQPRQIREVEGYIQ
jgi:hypothetical protein